MKQEQYSDFIKKYRTAWRINQGSLATHLGFTASHLSQIESGEKTIKLDKFKRIITAINELSGINSKLVKQAEEILKS